MSTTEGATLKYNPRPSTSRTRELEASLETKLEELHAAFKNSFVTSAGRGKSEPSVAEPSALGPSLYPQVFDENERSGLALRHFRAALETAGELPDLYLMDPPDLQGVDSGLTRIGALVNLAYPYTDFNSALGPLTSYIRRAVLFTERLDVDYAALVQLKNALSQIVTEPMMSFDTATDLSIEMDAHGWRGDNQTLVDLTREMMADPLVPEELKEAVRSA